MSPLKLIIPGRYWDSQIYRGRLHLFGMDGEILTLDWDELIDNLRVEDRLRLAVRSAFQRSDFLYGVAATGILDDVGVREIMIRRFHSLSEAPLEVGKQEIDRTTLGLPCTRMQGWTNQLPPCSVTAWSIRTRYYRPFVRLSRKLASSGLWRTRR